jgi:hypothetical protein
LRRFKHTQENFQIDQDPKASFMVLPTFDVLPEETAKLGSIGLDGISIFRHPLPIEARGAAAYFLAILGRHWLSA